MGALGTVVEATHLTTLGALVGVVVLDPTAALRRAPDWAGWLTGQQHVDRTMSRLAPPLFLSTAAGAAAAAVAAGVRHQPRQAAGRVLAAGLVVAAVAVTLRRNEPLNADIRGWRPDEAPALRWRETRADWERAHRVRRALIGLAAAAAVAG